MKRTKRILQWLVGTLVGIYLALLLLFHIPLVQRWMARGAEQILADVTGTRVEIGRLQMNWNGRLIVDDLDVWDQQGEEMLRVARLAARLGFSDLLRKRIRIGNAQLFGLHANLYQQCEGCDPNFKFLIDAFASKDTTHHTPLDLRISQILVRRGNIRWEQRWNPNKPDIALNNLNLTAQLNCLTDDSLNVRVKRLDFEEHRGLSVNALSFNLSGNKRSAILSDFALRLPHSDIEIPALNIQHEGPRLKGLAYQGSIDAHLSPTDFTTFVPRLTEVKDEVDLSVYFRGKEDRVNITSLNVTNNERQLRLQASAQAENLRQAKDSLRLALNIKELFAASSALAPYVQNDILQRLETIAMNGTVRWAHQAANADLDIHTALGSLGVKGQGSLKGAIDATVTSEGFLLGDLLDRKELGNLALDLSAKGTVGKQPDLTIQGRIPELQYKGYRYRNIDIRNLRIHDSMYSADLAVADPNASLDIQGEADLASHFYNVRADIAHLAPHMLNLTKRYAQTTFSGTLFADLQGTNLSNISGVAQLNDFAMTDTIGQYRPGDIHITSRPNEEGSHMLLISPFLEAQLEGNLDFKTLVAQVKRMVSNYLPTADKANTWRAHHEATTTDPATQADSDAQPQPTSNQGLLASSGTTAFILRFYSAEPLQRLLDIPLTLKGTTIAHGEMNSAHNAMWLNLKSPGMQYGKEDLRNIDLRLESNYESVLANLGLQRQMKGRWVKFGMDTQGQEGKLTTRLYFNNSLEGEESPAKTYAGDVNIVSRLWRDLQGKQGFEGEILPSNLIISDTLWSIHPGSVAFYDGALRVDSFCVSQGQRFIRVDGRATKSPADTLHAQLQRINLEYIFSLINFHAVELTGEATGDAYAHSLFSSPKADAYMQIPQFALNYGTLGDLTIHLNWGDQPYSIFLNGAIEDADHPVGEGPDSRPSSTLVQGYITPKKDVPHHGLDLSVQAERINLEFINKWTSAIFDDMQGRATGFVHIFGPFKQINIEGDALVNEASLGVPFIGVRYHLEGDSIHLRPNHIYFSNARLYDPQGSPGSSGHYGLVNGHLRHQSFKNLSYDIAIEGHNILGYNFQDFGDQRFYGTVYATGDITLKGHPGEVRIGIKAHPERGTTFTYNATSPDRLTETPFITYRSTHDFTSLKNLNAPKAPKAPNDPTNAKSSDTQEDTPKSDMFIDFDLDIDEQSTMNLLMDARSGDKISLNGSGHMLAYFYNKGSFQLLGTYRVGRGTYNLSLQEVIHKNFDFSPDGTITFNGEPYEADLDLQAVHTVSGVSLNDINPRANFSNTTTRVNCLMNIGGKARAPRITFDFDIPNANEDEKQMVRSLISTDEERNMQVVYLLGIGRFYAYNYANDNQAQGTTAMNSLLSSTLSGTINQMLSSMIGSRNWNFGANLRTGTDGWNDMDVEGMLQGSLLNNRLLINGNFGYRDNPMANTNFIGDFDVKYLLTRSGSVALKAYSETNDRYFTKSSLYTQGIGVLLKKDFTSWRDLVTLRKRRMKLKQ